MLNPAGHKCTFLHGWSILDTVQERCSETNAEGNPCGGYVLSDGKCYSHGGRRDGPKPKAKPRLSAELARRLAEGELTAVSSVLAAAVEDWRAAAWFLERAHPERWGKPSTALRSPPSKPPEESEVPPTVEPPPGGDPFSEVDELAARRAG